MSSVQQRSTKKLAAFRNYLADLPLEARSADHTLRIALVASEVLACWTYSENSARRGVMSYQIKYPVLGLHETEVNIQLQFAGSSITEITAIFPAESLLAEEFEFNIGHLRPEDL